MTDIVKPRVNYIMERRATAELRAAVIYSDALETNPNMYATLDAFIDTLITESDGVEHRNMVRMAMYHRLQSAIARIIGE